MDLYIKRGRKYVLWGHAAEYDTMRVGTFRLAYAYSAGGKRFEYDVRPDTASFVAAATLAREAMEKAIAEKVKLGPQSKPYTKQQMAIVKRFRGELDAAGALFPIWLQGSSAHDIAEAAIKAVREFK